MDKKIHEGPIHMDVPGRTDRIPVHVRSGSYVFPADTVSSLGEGNTLAGYKVIEHMFLNGDLGERFKRAKGGKIESKAVPVIVAGGEYILSPEHVAAIGDGNVDVGHAVLDAFVKQHRKNTIKELKKLPGPAKD